MKVLSCVLIFDVSRTLIIERKGIAEDSMIVVVTMLFESLWLEKLGCKEGNN